MLQILSTIAQKLQSKLRLFNTFTVINKLIERVSTLNTAEYGAAYSCIRTVHRLLIQENMVTVFSGISRCEYKDKPSLNITAGHPCG